MPIVRIYVDLPPILGPVNITVLHVLKSQSLGIHVRTHGWCILLPFNACVNIGLLHGVYDPALELITVTKVVNTSS